MLDHRGHWIGPDEWFLAEDEAKQAGIRQAGETGPAEAATSSPETPKIRARTGDETR